MEDRISATLKSIQDRLPGLDLYRRIYAENQDLDGRLTSAIVEAYDSFVEFCIAALDFYTKSGACECSSFHTIYHFLSLSPELI